MSDPVQVHLAIQPKNEHALCSQSADGDWLPEPANFGVYSFRPAAGQDLQIYLSRDCAPATRLWLAEVQVLIEVLQLVPGEIGAQR